jgi:hypothetical protein
LAKKVTRVIVDEAQDHSHPPPQLPASPDNMPDRDDLKLMTLKLAALLQAASRYSDGSG